MVGRSTKAREALKNLKSYDVFSVLLFSLYKLKNKPEYLTLVELCYILDKEDLTRFLSYFGGNTLTIPTIDDLKLVTQSLLMFKAVDIEGGDYEATIKAIISKNPEITRNMLIRSYDAIKETVDNYDFRTDHLYNNN